MIVPDVNLLVYAYNADDPRHNVARKWFEDQMSGTLQVAFAWVVLSGFIRVMTHPRIMERPIAPGAAVEHVRSWLELPIACIIEPGRHHLEILGGLLAALGTAGNLTTDAVLAALAIEHQAELHSNDVDFARFPGLMWENPLA